MRRQKSTCNGDGSDCVEVARAPTPIRIRIRDSRHAAGPRLALTPGA
ncbi:DUF397 domain-containing protein [Streptomyces glaucus]